MMRVWYALVVVFTLVLCARSSLDQLADWAEGEPLLLEEDNLRLAQASIEIDWGQREPVDVRSLENFAARGQELGETVLADLHNNLGITGYIQPDPVLYSANRTVFVASIGGSLNSTTCGSIVEPCATLAQALELSDSVVLLPGDHIIHQTVAVRDRTSVSISGVMENSMTRPRVILAHGVPPCPLLTLVEAGIVTLDSISFSDWTCNNPERCRVSAVEILSALECSLLNCHFKNNSKAVHQFSGNIRGCSFTYASVTGRKLLMDNCIVSNNSVRVSPQGEGASVSGTAVTLFASNATISSSLFAGITGIAFNFGNYSPVSFYGALFSLGSLEVRNCSFISTSHRCEGYYCSSLGGAIYNSARVPAPNALFIVSGSLFYKCLASAAYPGSTAGGALVVYAHTETTIVDSSFDSNSLAAGTDVSLPLSGGSLFVSGVAAEVRNCDFHANTVAVNAGTSGNTGSGGAALFAMGHGPGVVTMQTCNFEGNSVGAVGTSSSTGSASFGGAVYCSGSVETHNCTFLGNSATGGDSELVGGQAAGGALMQFLRIGNATVTGCRFENNEVFGGSGTVAALAVGGGAISASGVFYSSLSVFSGNKATGGALVVADSRLLPPRTGGSAAGGALLLQSDSELLWSSFEGNMVVAGVTTKGPCGPVAGGAVAASGGRLRVNATDFLSNEGYCGENLCSWCTGVGGALAVANSFATVHSSLFATNSLRGGNHGSFGSLFGAALSSLVHLGHLSCDVEDSTFSDNFISGGRSFGGAVFASADSRFLHSLFVANTATGYAGAYGGAIASRPNVVEIAGSSVVGNEASAIGTAISGGGAVYAADWNLVWTEESLFIGNTAGFGGAIFFWSSGIPLSNYDYTLQGAFYDNAAAELGGVTYFHNIDRSHGQTDCIVQGSGNIASCGSVCGGAVFQGVLLGSYQENVWPGQSQNLEFGIEDIFGQVCERSYYSAQVRSSNGTVFQSNAPQDQASSSSAGVYSIPGVQVFGGPGTLHKLETTLACSVPIGWYPSFLLETEYHLRQCSPGHFLVSNSSCTPCDTQTYNFDGSLCVACPLSGQQCMRFLDQTAMMFQIVPGLYPTSFTNPVGLDACPFASSCPSYNCSVVPADDDLHWDINCAECREVASGLDCTCADGYTGRLCSECIFNEEQCYFRTNGQCANSATLPLGLWGPALEFLCYVIVTVAFFSLRQDAEKGTMKTMLFFVQTTAAFSGGVILPFGLIDLLASLTSGMVLNWLNVAALRCLSYDLFSSRVLVVSILALMPGLVFFPLVVLVHLITLLMTDAYRSRKGPQSSTLPLSLPQSPIGSPQHSPTSSPQHSPPSSPQHSSSSSPPSSPLSSPHRLREQSSSSNSLSLRSRLVDKCIHSALYIQYAAFFSICNILFVSWGCEKQESTGKWYAINMPWLQCGEGDWLRLLLATSALTLVCVVLPCCLFAYVLYQNRNALDEPAVIRRYGFLYGSYKRKFYFWELLALLRRLTLSFSLSAFAKGEALYYCFPIAVHLISAACQIQFQPLHTKRENMMEVLAIFSVIFSFEASHRIDSLDSLVDFDTWFVEITVMLANGAVLFALLWIIGHEIQQEYRQKAMRYYGRLVGYGRQLRSFASFHGSL